MKNMLVIGVLAALSGCATYPSSPAYGTRYAQPADPSQWRVVSVTPVAPGTGDRIAASSPDGKRVEYSSRPITVSEPVYVAQPIYVQQPVYVPQPVYVQEPSYYYPPVSLSLGFVFGRHWSHGGGYGRGHGGRGWRR